MFPLLTLLVFSSCANPSLSSSQGSSSSSNFSSMTSLSINSSDSIESSNVVMIRDQSYGSFERNTLDIIYEESDKPKPLVLVIHGGSWITGDKRDVEFFSIPLIEAGYVYVAMNYRLMLTPATFIDMLNDIQTAILFLYLNARSLNLRTDAMAIGGVSAGAHLAMLYAYQRIPAIPIQFVFGLVPPVDFTDPSFLNMPGASFQLTQMNALTGTAIQSQEEVIQNGFPLPWLEASPIHYASSAKPTLIGYAGLDELVPVTNVPRLLTRFDEFDIAYESIFFQNSYHNLMGDPEQTLVFNVRLMSLLSFYLSEI